MNKQASTQALFDKPRPTQSELRDACTATHPDHECFYAFDGEPWFWNAWCSVCEERGYSRPTAGLPNPDMTAEYLAAARAWAAAEHLKKPKRERHVCECGHSHWLKT